MEVVDAHMHLWTSETHPWLLKVKDGGHPAGSFAPVIPYMLEDYRKDTADYNVTHCVHVEAAWPGDPVGETRWLDNLADQDPQGRPSVIIGHADLTSENLEDVLQRHCQSKRFRGIRHMLNHHPDKPQYSETSHDNYLTDPVWRKGVELLEKYNLSFEMHVLPHQLKRAADVVKHFPKVMFMINHCGIPYDKDSETTKIWNDGLTEVAQYPNAYCKVSGVFATDPKWTKESVSSVVLPCLKIFGMDRCVFASNFPVDKVNGSYAELMTVLQAILEPYSAEDKQKFFCLNAKKFYRI